MLKKLRFKGGFFSEETELSYNMILLSIRIIKKLRILTRKICLM